MAAPRVGILGRARAAVSSLFAGRGTGRLFGVTGATTQRAAGIRIARRGGGRVAGGTSVSVRGGGG